MDGIEFKAHKVEQAIELGLKELQLTKDEVDIEIISNGGLFSKAAVKITPKIKPEQAAADFINNLFSYMRFDAYATLTTEGGENKIDITGSDSPLLIGYRGEILDSVQYLALIIANKYVEDFIRISVNTENYREKRKEVLAGLAQKLAVKAERTGRKVELEPMNPYERRIIHAALQGHEAVTTESVGEEPNRYLVIIPKNPRPSSFGDRPERAERGERGGYGSRDGNRDGNRGNGGGYGNRSGGGYGGNREGGYGNRDGSRGGYGNRGGGGYGGNREGGYGNRDGNRGGYGNRDGNRGGYGNREGGYGGNRGGYGERGGYASGGEVSRAEVAERSETEYENKYTQAADVQRETITEEIKDKDYSDVNNNFSGNFKKTGTTNMKSFGYKKR
ncbi:MAG: protein jag [Clostridiales bacterium]|jgi:spoIIIJ-associated protein|nr:protein jag [Clostridiales bacterium]